MTNPLNRSTNSILISREFVAVDSTQDVQMLVGQRVVAAFGALYQLQRCRTHRRHTVEGGVSVMLCLDRVNHLLENEQTERNQKKKTTIILKLVALTFHTVTQSQQNKTSLFHSYQPEKPSSP